MNNAKVAAALNTISLAFGELAEALTENATAPVSAPPRTDSGDFIPESVIDEVVAEIFPAGEGSLAQCPKHHKPYLDGTYGPYCPSLSDDPAWANRKGYCRITPKNAAAWMRIQAA